MSCETEKDCLVALIEAVHQTQAELSDIRILLDRMLGKFHADELARGIIDGPGAFRYEPPRPTILHALLGDD